VGVGEKLMRFWPFILALLMLVALIASAMPQPTSQPLIADVRTVGDLRAVPAVQIGAELRVHFGVAESKLGPWMMVYCLAESDGTQLDRRRDDQNEPLGPVSVAWYGEREVAVKKQTSRPAAVIKGPVLFSRTLVANGAGLQHLKILGPAGEEITTREFRFAHPRGTSWGVFKTSHDSVDHEGAAACPLISGDFGRSLPTLPDGSVDDQALLPGIDDRPTGDIELSIRGGAFVVHCGQKMFEWPDDLLLARWWRNGVAIDAPYIQPKMLQAGRQIVETNEFVIPFDVPPRLGPVHSGDKVAIQILYSPGATSLPPPTGAQHYSQLNTVKSADPPRISDRLKFDITDDLVRAARSNR
jgi:hypothetical protein